MKIKDEQKLEGPQVQPPYQVNSYKEYLIKNSIEESQIHFKQVKMRELRDPTK